MGKIEVGSVVWVHQFAWFAPFLVLILLWFAPPLDNTRQIDIAWSATFVCVAISVLFARSFLDNNPRLYTAIALFACVWMLVLASYGDVNDLFKNQPEDVKELYRTVVGIASDIAAVLLAYVGALLIADVHAQLEGRPLGVRWEQRVPLYLLFLVAVPQAISIPGPLGRLAEYFFGGPQVSSRHVGLIVSQILVFAGFASLARGTYLISGPSTRFKVLAVVLALYWLTILYRTIEIWPGHTPSAQFYRLTVASAKVAVTALLVFAVYIYNRDGPPQTKAPS
jgi:hypothetical protein